MPNMHFGRSIHTTFHPVEVKSVGHPSPPDIAPRGSSHVVPSTHTATLTASSHLRDLPREHTSHFIGNLADEAGAATSDRVLRLRGGGNTQGSEGKGGDRDRLVGEGTSSGGNLPYHGTQSRSEARRAANEAKRYALQGRLGDARRRLDEARRRHDNALTTQETATAAIRRLEDEIRQAGADPLRRDAL